MILELKWRKSKQYFIFNNRNPSGLRIFYTYIYYIRAISAIGDIMYRTYNTYNTYLHPAPRSSRNLPRIDYPCQALKHKPRPFSKGGDRGEGMSI